MLFVIGRNMGHQVEGEGGVMVAEKVRRRWGGSDGGGEAARGGGDEEAEEAVEMVGCMMAVEDCG